MKAAKKNLQQKISLTKEYYQELQHDFKKYKKELAQVKIRLNLAREMGDLSENGAYKYAKFEISSLNRRLRRIRHLLQNGEVASIKKSDKVGFGSTVTLQTGKDKRKFLIVSQHESDPSSNKLSVESPIGSAILGKQAGDRVSVDAPVGVLEYEIVEVA